MKSLSSKDFILKVQYHINSYIKNKKISSITEKEESELYWIINSLVKENNIRHYSMEYETLYNDNGEYHYVLYQFYNPHSEEYIIIYLDKNNIFKEKYILKSTNYIEINEREYYE